MKIYCIGTGSSGNCYIIEYEPHKAFMLDCGLPSAEIKDYLKEHKLINCIKFCLISHLHGDHLHDSTILKALSIPTYFSEDKKSNQILKEIKEFEEKNGISITHFDIYPGKEFKPKGDNRISIIPFVVPHDARNYAYKIILPNGKKMIYMTDFGNIETIKPFAEKIDYWLVECNYGVGTLEENMANCLDANKLKIQKRSAGDGGHCSNFDCYTWLKRQGNIKNSNILLIHKSADNLMPERDYKIFKNIECISCKPIEEKTIYEFK